MNWKVFLRKTAPRLLAAVLVIALLAVAATSLMKGRAGLITDLEGRLRRPFQQGAETIASFLEGLYGSVYGYDQLKAENETLREQLAAAQAEARAGQEALEENERLRQLLAFSQRHTDYDLESAKVVSFSASNWSALITISKGDESGIEVGDSVITESGSLVGQVIEVGSGWSTVRTIIDVDMNVGGYVSNCVVRGNSAYCGGGVAQAYVTHSIISNNTHGAGVHHQGLQNRGVIMWRDLIRKDRLRSILLLALYLALTLLVQNTLFAKLRIWGVHVIVLPALMTAVGMFRGPVWGGVFGIFAGVFANMGYPESIVLFILLLPLIGYVTGMLSEHLLTRSLVAFLCMVLGAQLLTAFFQLFRLWVFQGAEFKALLITGLKQTAVSLPFSIPFFYISRAVNRRERAV